MSEFPSSLSASQRLAGRLPPTLLTARFWFVAYAAWFVLLFILSSLSGTDTPKFPTHSDKVIHFLYFAGGGFALASAFLFRPATPPLVFIVAITLAAGALVGLFDEWHQTFTPHRSGLDLGDGIADVLGTGAGLASAFLARRWLRANASNFPPSA
jgi:VanZ family protein